MNCNSITPARNRPEADDMNPFPEYQNPLSLEPKSISAPEENSFDRSGYHGEKSNNI
jgi:hypothetical protein